MLARPHTAFGTASPTTKATLERAAMSICTAVGAVVDRWLGIAVAGACTVLDHRRRVVATKDRVT